MVYGIEKRRGFIAMIGEVGSGKTTLIHSLIRSLDEKTLFAFIFYPSGTYTDLLRNILMEFDIDAKEKSNFDMHVEFHHFVIGQFSRGKNIALIFDEAQNMSSEVLEQLRLLSNLESPEEKLFQIILAGQPELSNKLNRTELRQLRQRIGIRCEIEPLTAPEIRNYIGHRLKMAGYEGRLNLFSRGALDLICRYSKGIPRMVNILCDNSLLIAYGLDRKMIDETIVKEVLADLKIEQAREKKIADPKYPVVAYPAPKSSNRVLWVRSTILSILLFLAITIFLIQGDYLSNSGAYVSKVAEATNKIGMLFAISRSKIKGETPVAVVPSPEARPREIIEKPEQETEKMGEEISLILSPESKEPTPQAIKKKLNNMPYDLNSWAVQVFSSQSLTEARQLKDQLRDRDLPAYLIVGALNGETWYGVRIGYYALQKEAIETGKKIALEFNAFGDYFTVRHPRRK